MANVLNISGEGWEEKRKTGVRNESRKDVRTAWAAVSVHFPRRVAY